MTRTLSLITVLLLALCCQAQASAHLTPHHPPRLLMKPALYSLGADVQRYTPKGFALKRPIFIWPAKPEVVEHGPRTRKSIALTFDACSTRVPSRYDARITEILEATGTRATIFLGGKWMLEEPEHTKRLAASPLFELGNHSFLHPLLLNSPGERIKEELVWTERILYTLTGRTSEVMRPPYALHNDLLVRVTAGLGMKTIEYDLASGDPDPAMSAERLVRRVLRKARPGSIVVMHINGNGHNTAEALPEIIAGLRKRGFAFVTVSELLDPTRLPVPLKH